MLKKGMATLLVQILLASFIYLMVEGQPQPANGDIRLEKYTEVPNYYEVLIYYSDGIQPPEWGGICAGVSLQTQGVICRQLGYFNDNSDPESRYTGRPVWLKNLDCNNDYSHILQCKYDVVTGADRNSSMSCGQDQHRRLLIKCDFDVSNKLKPEPNEGELRLCPPDDFNTNSDIKSSVSIGVVALHLYSEWRGIVQLSEERLGSDEANAICRQLGYTDAVVGSAVAKSATQKKFTKCYDSNNDRGYHLQSNAWTTTESITCNHPQNCFRCCYKNLPKTGCMDNSCDLKQDIVIGCTFDPSRNKSLQHQQLCEKNLGCELEACSSERKDAIILGFFLVLLTVVICFLLSAWLEREKGCIRAAYQRFRNYHRLHGHNNMRNNQGNNPPQGDNNPPQGDNNAPQGDNNNINNAEQA